SPLCVLSGLGYTSRRSTLATPQRRRIAFSLHRTPVCNAIPSDVNEDNRYDRSSGPKFAAPAAHKDYQRAAPPVGNRFAWLEPAISSQSRRYRAEPAE